MSPLYESLSTVTEKLFDAVVNLNFKGPFRLSTLVGERMVADAGGSIINVSSSGSRRPRPEMLPYSASKAWDLDATTKGAQNFALKRLGNPPEIIGAALFLARLSETATA